MHAAVSPQLGSVQVRHSETHLTRNSKRAPRTHRHSTKAALLQHVNDVNVIDTQRCHNTTLCPACIPMQQRMPRDHDMPCILLRPGFDVARPCSAFCRLAISPFRVGSASACTAWASRLQQQQWQPPCCSALSLHRPRHQTRSLVRCTTLWSVLQLCIDPCWS